MNEEESMKVWWFATAGLAVLGLAAVAFAVLGPSLAAGDESEYLTATASTADVTDEIAATGTLLAARSYTLSFGSGATVADATPSSAETPSTASDGADAASGATSSVEWEVTAVDVTVGDHVDEGDALATADTANIDADIGVAQAQVDAAQARVDTATTDEARATAESQLLEAERTLAQLQAAREHVTLVAPAPGVVTVVNVDVGSAAPYGAAIVIASDDMVASGTVSETDVSTIAVGQEAALTLAALDDEAAGEVTYVAPSGSSTSGVVGFGILVTLDDVPEGARPGMSADIRVVAAEALDVLAVPSAAIDGSAGSYVVTVLASDGSTETRPVEVGLVTDELAEITDGLSDGDTVVTGTASDQQTTTNGGGGFGGPGGGFGGPGGGFAPPGGN
jgi:macrolide-specific efflux system membrane fusion protein